MNKTSFVFFFFLRLHFILFSYETETARPLNGANSSVNPAADAEECKW